MDPFWHLRRCLVKDSRPISAALVTAAGAWWGGGMALSGTYEPSPSDWVREQVEKFEASDGQEANT